MWDLVLENTVVYLLVFARMAGMILPNPLLSRRNVPARVRMGLILCLTLVVAPTVDTTPLAGYSDFALVEGVLREALLGIVTAMVFQVFYYFLYFAGDIMDFHFGLSMAKVFDPGSNIQSSLSGSILSLLFILLLFSTGGHLLLIKIFATSYQILPIGAAGLSAEIGSYMLRLFVDVFALVIRLILPFVAVEFTLEVSMGVLMKLIPQIHVFVINVQFKLMAGILLLIFLGYPMGVFLENYGAIMFRQMERALFTLAG